MNPLTTETHNAKRQATVLVVFGTRPEAIKLAPVIAELGRRERIRTVMCTTGQHREMLAQMLEVFGLKPEHNLDVMKPSQSLADVTTSVLSGMDQLVASVRPDVIIVQGDTTTAFAASLAAFYHRVAIGHVEAGLRTDDKYNPFPEEINRRLVSPMADFHFAPTEVARQNLLREGIDDRKIAVTGNTVIDALYYVRARIRQDRSLVPALLPDADGQRLIVVTAHRRENFGGALHDICRAIGILAATRSDIRIAYPVHLNPNVAGPVHEMLGGLANVDLLPPLDYVSFVALMDRASILLSDSGGIQEEGPALGKPVLVMREVSERPEAISAGTARLVGTDSSRIVREVVRLLDDPDAYRSMATVKNPFGDGTASVQIADFLEAHLR